MFVLTDDFILYEHARTQYDDCKFFTLCRPEDAGYDNSKFTTASPKDKWNSICRLIASIEILRKASFTIGTITTNPGVFLSLWKTTNLYYVDYDDDLDKVVTIPPTERCKFSASFLKLN